MDKAQGEAKVRVCHGKSRPGVTVLKTAAGALVVFACAAPAAGLNLQYGIDEGRSVAHIAGMIGLVLGAALAGIALERAAFWRQRIFALLCLVLFCAVNVANALGLVASHRASGQSGAKTEIDRAASLGEAKVRVAARLARLKGEASGQSRNALQADILTREADEIYRRSGGCSDVTRADTRVWCGELFKRRAELATAEEIEKLRTQLGDIETELRSVQKPVAVDPQAEDLGALLGMPADDAGLLIDALTAIAIECLAGFGPALVLACMGPRAAPERRMKVSTGEGVAVGQTADRAPVDALRSFVTGLVPSENWTSNTALMQSYMASCDGLGVPPKSQVAISKALVDAGFRKRKLGGRVQWALRERHGLTAIAS